MTSPSRTDPVEPGTTRGPLAAILVGLVAGALSGLFGVGGGIVIVPGLLLVMRLPARMAYGTSLAAVLPISVASLSGYWTSGKVDWTAALLLSSGSVIGAVLGTRLLRVISQRVLAAVFIAVLLVTAVRLVADHSSALGRGPADVPMALGLFVVGLATGVLAGLLGVGGGMVMIPAMVLLYGIPPAIAKGTSVAVIIPTSIMGTWRNHRHRNTDLRVAAMVGFSGVVSAFAMSKVSVGLDPRTSNVLFALLLLAVAFRMIWDEWRQRQARRRTPPPDPLVALGE